MIYRFGDCELDAKRGELRRAGHPVELQPKPLALLGYLLDHRDRVVPKQELLDRLWHDVVVTDASLSKAVSVARRAIGDIGKRGYIRSFSRRGYRFVGEAVAAEGPASGALPAACPGATAQASTDAAATAASAAGESFVGRDEALARLEAAWNSAAGGRGGLVLIRGPAGIGKTRLCEVFGERVRGRGGRLLLGRADPSEGSPAFWTWHQVLRDLVATSGDPEAAELEAELADPERADRTPDDSQEQARFRFLDRTAQCLLAASHKGPLVILLEDLQWARRASLALCEHLAGLVSTAPCLVVATVREEHRERGHPLHHTLGILAQLADSETIELSGFEGREVAEILRHELGRAAPRPLVDALMERTEGNPLFLRETLRMLREGGRLAFPEASDWDLTRLPRRTRDIVKRSLEVLPARCVELLECASVLGRDFSLSLLADVSGCDRETALDALDEAIAAGVVTPADEAPAGYRFAHALFLEVAYAGIAPGRRARLHLRAAGALERIHRNDIEPALPELARHLHRGLGAGDPARAAEVAAAAALRARTTRDWDRACEHFTQLVTAVEQLEPRDPERLIDALLELGSAARDAGDRLLRRRVLRRALTLSREREDPERFARAATLFCDLGEWSPNDDEARLALQEALDWIGPQPSAVRAGMLARTAYLLIVDRDVAEPLSRRAVAMAREVGEPDTIQETLYTLHYVLSGADGIAERREIWREIEAVVGRGRDRDLAVIALIDLACDALMEGDRAAADARRIEAARLAGDKPHPGLRFHLEAYDAGLAFLEGRFEDAELGFRDSFLIGQLVGHPYAPQTFAANTFYLLRERGELASFEPHLAPMRASARSVAKASPINTAFAAAMSAAFGRREHAARLVSHLGADLDRLIGRLDWTPAACEVATVLCLLHDTYRCQVLYDALLPYAGQHAVVPVPILYNGPISRTLGLLALELGQGQRAEEHLREALEQCQELGARPMLARTRIELADVLQRRGQASAARPLLEEACAGAEKLGLGELARRAREAIAR